MDDGAWARHANPWSGWTRVATLPLLVLAAWSRVWIGWWALPVLLLLFAWVWWNPRAFPPPLRWEAWMTRGVLGERLWLARDEMPVPERHRRVPNLLSAVASLGGLVMLWGVVMLEPWPTLAGMAVAMLGKLWFVDRMVWLHQDMGGRTP
jgi:hypothetical protein